MKLKICGMKEPGNILEAAQLQPDYMGFIFWEKSARFFSGVIPELPSSIEKTGVFVDASFDEIMVKAGEHGLSHIQLHGNESPALGKKLQTEGLKVIKAFSIGNGFDFSLLEPFDEATDYFLFDTKGKLPGGNGFSFDWSILDGMPSGKPIFLSGGIGPGDVEQLQKISPKLYAADLNSRFESSPGIKNIALLQKFKDDYYGL